MTARAPNWYETKYIGGVIYKLQSQGFLLKPGMNESGEIKGSNAVWKIAGEGVATERSTAIEDRPTMNADRSTITGTLKDYEANDWINTTDLTKMSENEQQVAMKTGAMALGRKFDSLVLDEMNTLAAAATIDTIGDGSTAISITDVMQAQGDIADVGVGTYEYYMALPIGMLQQLELYREISNSQFVGDEFPLLKQVGARKWRGITFIPMPKKFFNNPASTQRDAFMWSKECTGFVANYAGLQSRADYVPTKKAYFAANDMSACPKVLLPEGVKRLRFNVTTLARPTP